MLSDRFQNRPRIRADALFSLFIIAGVGVMASLLMNSRRARKSEIDNRIETLLREEDRQSRPFPKEVDMAPDFD